MFVDFQVIICFLSLVAVENDSQECSRTMKILRSKFDGRVPVDLSVSYSVAPENDSKQEWSVFFVVNFACKGTISCLVRVLYLPHWLVFLKKPLIKSFINVLE